MASLLLEAALAGLLVATIVYAILLDRRLRALRQSRDEMQAMIANFMAATAHAQSNIAALREASQTTAADLRGEIERAKGLRDDLNFLVDRGGSLADRLEGDVGAARAAMKAAAPKPQADSSKPETDAGAERAVVRLSETKPSFAKSEAKPRFGKAEAKPELKTMPGAKILSKRPLPQATDDEMASELLRALQAAR